MGAEVNYRDNIWSTCDCGSSIRADLLAGFRYLNLNESLTMTEDVTRLTASPMFPDEVAGTHILNSERFGTDNNFYGGQLGTSVSYRNDRWTADLRATVALGTTDERLNIDGSQVRAIPGGQTVVLRGGLLALPSNIGEFNRNVFSVVPEVGLNVGYQMTDHIRAFVGYNFLYWSNVIRPGDQIDRVIDINNIPRFVNVPPGTIPAVFPAASGSPVQRYRLLGPRSELRRGIPLVIRMLLAALRFTASEVGTKMAEETADARGRRRTGARHRTVRQDARRCAGNTVGMSLSCGGGWGWPRTAGGCTIWRERKMSFLLQSTRSWRITRLFCFGS